VRNQLARICTRLNVRMVSTPFEDKSYYVNIRKAITAGYFMQVRPRRLCFNPLHSVVGCCADGAGWLVSWRLWRSDLAAD
jgi:hypothetical protein